MKYTVRLEENEHGDLIVPLSDELCNEVGWKIGDTISWKDNGDGSFVMTKAVEKVETELVLVECVSTFLMRYVVEVPKGHSDWALDSVTMEEAQELSQIHLGEQIISHRVISDEEYIDIFDKDNDYLKSWPIEKKRNMITKLGDEEKPDDVKHSEFYWDTERNK